MNVMRRVAATRPAISTMRLYPRGRFARGWIEAAAMTLVGLPVALVIGMLARAFHYNLTAWLGAAMCCAATAASKAAANRYLRRSLR